MPQNARMASHSRIPAWLLSLREQFAKYVYRNASKRWRYRFVSFERREDAEAAAYEKGVVALVNPGALKWAYLKCPCGCKEQLQLNLMASRSPRWTVKLSTGGLISIAPSIDAKHCGAHFFLRDSRIIWCED
ncbi:DUF6527 family protein [Cognatiluteimonas telluris]|uniref:DUF6527 family protein n=1 Tax=Cognatiluteimonas telluris TaxID=1104775 RepID=UPI00140C2AA4|nr:DUF6527 family protein [Lysobacter telluris]